MTSSLAERIRIARENKDLMYTHLSKKIMVSTETLQLWEAGEEIPDKTQLNKLARCVGVRASWLLTGHGKMEPISSKKPNVFPLHKDSLSSNVMLMEIPVLSSIPAGKTTAIFYPEHVDRYVTVDNLRDRGAFALVVKGNSMSPRIEEGDIVVVSPKQEPRSGDICVVRVNDEDVLKKVKIDDNYVHLIPLNTLYEPLTVRKTDVSVIWKVVKVIKNL